MKSSFVRAAFAAALVLGLAGCGGEAQFDINGTVRGLNYPGLVLYTHGQTVSPTPQFDDKGVAKDVSFRFPETIPYGVVYEVSVQTNPPHQACTVANPSDTAGRTSTINIFVTCVQNSYRLTGKVTGLPVDGTVVLANGSEGTVTVKATTTVTEPQFTFFVRDDRSYGITVLEQPAGYTCTVSQNGVGIVDRSDIQNVQVTCAAN